MRKVVALVVALACAVPGLASAASEGCYSLTVSAAKEFRKGLTPRERAAAKAEGVKRGCPTKPVKDGTPGAVDVAQARSILPHVKEFFRNLAPPAKVAAKVRGEVKAKVGKRGKPAVRPKGKPVAKVQPMPRPRPIAAPAAELDRPALEAPAAAPAQAPAAQPDFAVPMSSAPAALPESLKAPEG